jgi:recombination protein RecR
MHIVPAGLQRLIDAFGALPGVGSRTAERYAQYLLKQPPKKALILAESLQDVHSSVKTCPTTFALIDASEMVSPLYSDPSRNKQLVAVVAEPFDVIALEKTGLFKGTYHVLGGLLSPIDNILPEQLTIQELVARIKTDAVNEVIIATNASVEGESTALFVSQQLSPTGVKVSRLARGIPVGVDLEYTDHVTLGRALEGRTTL